VIPVRNEYPNLINNNKIVTAMTNNPSPRKVIFEKNASQNTLW
jgi:hypothetical protein